jgi:CheY-like chemotaxis protein
VIHYIVADDNETRRNALSDLLQYKIQKEFGAAQGTAFGEVKEVLQAIKKSGSHFDLLVLDMEFYGDFLGGGLKVLEALTPQKRHKVVAYSAFMKKIMPTGRPLREEISVRFAIPPERVIDMLQGAESLWKACASVLKGKLG